MTTSRKLARLKGNVPVRKALEPFPSHILIPTPSRLNQNRRQQSSFFSTPPSLTRIPLSYNVCAPPSPTCSWYLTSILEVLCKSSNVKEILWNFRRFKDVTKRLTLRKNPHFYAWLPAFPEEYGAKFRTEPIETYLHRPHAKIHVLADNPSPMNRVYLETSQNTRAFGNIWIPNKAIIFKGSSLSRRSFSPKFSNIFSDVCGRLESESIVGAGIQDTFEIRYTVESPNFTIDASIRDWRAPIRRILQHPNVNVNIRIIAKPPGNNGPSCLAPYRTPQRALSGTGDERSFSGVQREYSSFSSHNNSTSCTVYRSPYPFGL
jgi:hypothetical protein